MRIELPLLFSILICGCAPASDPVAQSPLLQTPSETCAKAFGAIAPTHALPNTTLTYAAAAFTCEHANVETRALSLCAAPFPTHSLLRDPAGAAEYGLRKRTLSALMDAELFGEGLARKAEAERMASGGARKSEAGCHIVLDEFPQTLTQREEALQALGATGRY